jgi:hypothetical protein
VPDLADAAGRAVAVLIAAATRLRGAKPMHPRGVLFDAVLERTGPPRPWGVGWIDARSVDRVVVRLSRGAGLPARWPDLLGMAIRFPAPDDGAGPVDLLLSSTGRGPVSRMVPVLRRDAATVYSSIMSYGSPVGRVRFAALPERSGVPSAQSALAGEVARRGLRFTIAACLGHGEWEPIGRLELLDPVDPLDPEVHVDAVLHPPAGLTTDGPMARFRRPSYAAARRVRTVSPAARGRPAGRSGGRA